MRQVSADGDTWLVTSDGYDERRGVRTVVFHCLSNSQRPYRVVEIPEPLLADRTLDSIDDGELGDLFNRSQVLDFSHERSARRASHGYADPPME